MARAFTNFYDHVFEVLSNDAAVVALVPNSANIRPSEDRSEPEAGPVIHYRWEQAQWQAKQKRGLGRFVVVCADPDNKVDALEIMEAVRDAMSAKALSNVATPKVRVQRFDEAESLADSAAPSVTNRLEVTTEFEVRLIEAT